MERIGKLSAPYLDRFGEFPGHITPIGQFTYLRTYSRFKDQLGRRESWKETVQRATDYNVGLAEKHLARIGMPIDRAAHDAERELLFHNQFQLKQALSGRTLWVGGTDNGVADKFPLANFNCSFTNIGDQFEQRRNYDDLAELFYLLLVGTGVGFKITPQMAYHLPPVRTGIRATFDDYRPLPKWMRSEDTALITDEVYFNDELLRYEYALVDGETVPGTTAIIAVGDSKESWVSALKWYFHLLTNPDYVNLEAIRFNFNSVRPHGERLKTFGGTASGPDPLKEMFELFDKVIHGELDPSLAPLEQAAPGFVRLRPVHIADMANGVGHNVIVGGVRRTSEIYQFSGDKDAIDWESLFMKFGINGIWGDGAFAHVEKVRQSAIANNFPLPAFFNELQVKHYDVPYFEEADGHKIGAAKTFTDSEEARAFAATPAATEYRVRMTGSGDYAPVPYNKSRMHLGHRRMSNNSMVFHTAEPPSKRLLDFIFLLMQGEAEPGFINLYAAARRRLKGLGITDPAAIERHAYMIGLNPCAEIILYSKGVCNLTTVNVMAFVHGGYLDLAGLIEAQLLSVRSGLRMTLVQLELGNWDAVQQRDRLLGASLTGWKDAMGVLGYSPDEEASLLELLGRKARFEADRYAKELRVNAPLLVTTVKPEGTLSIVFGAVSSGLHVAHAPYYLRRIRINAADALAKTVQQLAGWRVYAEVGTAGCNKPDELSRPDVIAQARTLVIDFPVQSGAKKTKAETGVDEQFDTYFRFQQHYTEHNTSNTIHLQPDEWDRAAERVYAGWHDFVGVSFVAIDGGSYELMPYEECTEAAYHTLKDGMMPFDYNLLQHFEQPEQEDLSMDGMETCTTGSCPIR